MHNLIIALGSNADERLMQLEKALSLCQPFICIRRTSPVLETEAIGITAPPFANQLVSATTSLGLKELNDRLKDTELKLGRKRGGNIIAIDIDILQYDNQRLHEKDWCRQYIKTLITHL